MQPRTSRYHWVGYSALPIYSGLFGLCFLLGLLGFSPDLGYQITPTPAAVLLIVSFLKTPQRQFSMEEFRKYTKSINKENCEYKEVALHSLVLRILFTHVIPFLLLSMQWSTMWSLFAKHSTAQDITLPYCKALFWHFLWKISCLHTWLCCFAIKFNTKQFKYFLRNHFNYTGTIQTALNGYIAIGNTDGSLYVPGKITKEHLEAHHCLLTWRLVKNVSCKVRNVKCIYTNKNTVLQHQFSGKRYLF